MQEGLFAGFVYINNNINKSCYSLILKPGTVPWDSSPKQSQGLGQKSLGLSRDFQLWDSYSWDKNPWDWQSRLMPIPDEKIYRSYSSTIDYNLQFQKFNFKCQVRNFEAFEVHIFFFLKLAESFLSLHNNSIIRRT